MRDDYQFETVGWSGGWSVNSAYLGRPRRVDDDLRWGIVGLLRRAHSWCYLSLSCSPRGDLILALVLD